MIVEPDFLDHWKTRMLARLLKDERAPIYILRLWAHCQQRKTDRFTDWNPDVLASVCRWDTDGLTLWNAMGQTFLEIDGGNVVVHGWAETNAALISAWENGKLGGRPRAVNTGARKPIGNPPVNPPQTDRVTDRVDREEKSRGDGEEGDAPKAPKGARFTPPTREELDLAAAKLGLPPNEVDKFVGHYGGNGWKVGRNPMKSWSHSLTGWAARWREQNGQFNPNTGGGRNSQSAADVRRSLVAGADDVQRQAEATAAREREMVESGRLPW
jgi:hypothetical protein